MKTPKALAATQNPRKMEASVKFTHEESGSTITVASDGSMILNAKGDIKFKIPGKIRTVASTKEAAASKQRSEQVANALKGKMIADKLLARMKKGQEATASEDDDGDESKKWEGITMAIMAKLGNGSMTVQQVAEAIGRDIGETEMCLMEMQKYKGAVKTGEQWTLTLESASALIAKKKAAE